MVRARTVVPAALVTLCCALVAACGAGQSGSPQLGLPHSGAGVPLQLQLELPMVGLSSAAKVSYTTGESKPVLRGMVQPAGTPVYMLDGQGRRTVVEAKHDGTFDVRTSLMPGSNQFKFTAAHLGTTNRTATLTIDWQGPAADAMQAKIQANPVKYLPPASAGLNRKLPPLARSRRSSPTA
jgi:hypothetical protein